MTTNYNDRSVSKVEVTGSEARHYDFFMNMITGGTYPFFIRRAVKEMRIQPDDKILVLGAGTGRNISLMNNYLSEGARVLGLDIGPEMLEQAQHRFADHPYISIEDQRIDEQLPYQGEFDKVFISFVLHGFIQEDRLKIIANAQRALRPGGEFIILDYNEFDLEHSPWLVRFVFKMECPLATDFVGLDLQAILKEQGFDGFRTHPHYLGYVRLLAARKKGEK
ncbi:MAG TPA: methyltransferase domain-containing protein [Chloroflexi bacterium]|nr:methyltransferase domain-containing protein [Chloroflexota bacterium]